MAFKDGNMDKVARGMGLAHWQKVRNKCISSVRCGIEWIFGTFKRCRDFARSRYVGQARMEQEFFLVALPYNLGRARTLCFAWSIAPKNLGKQAKKRENGKKRTKNRRTVMQFSA